MALEGDRLVVAVPDEFAAKWNETNHGVLISRVAETVMGKPLAVVFRVQEDRQRRAQMAFFVTPPAPSASPVPAPKPSAQPLNERNKFETFVIGKSNQLAAAAAHAAVEAPGKTYNPLFIYGATGLGKTHLIQAIAHSILERAPDTRVLYVSAEPFTSSQR